MEGKEFLLEQLKEARDKHAEMVQVNMDLAKELSDIKSGRKVLLPSNVSPTTYNQILDWLKVQKESLKRLQKKTYQQ
jgi:hypothetical protein